MSVQVILCDESLLPPLIPADLLECIYEPGSKDAHYLSDVALRGDIKSSVENEPIQLLLPGQLEVFRGEGLVLLRVTEWRRLLQWLVPWPYACRSKDASSSRHLYDGRLPRKGNKGKRAFPRLCRRTVD